ncbi:MAG: tRNA (adenosine(37)-N6)-threonylcarbamoyltransferase complex dimerization subunit type 1 TsaB [Bacteroidales bacterium]|nr:tRNA (adenosine(37)-N6)-threonylcarbamoyltransferase complex dimerization subunit type 1 TsaB [Bacteroidales bacterium]
MSRILLIETSTSLCSTALAQNGKVLTARKSSEPRAHASMTAVFLKEMLDECGLRATDCDAVCVSAGPGSYTGLRVGSSTAKGICLAAGIPLLSLGTPDILAAQALSEGLLPEGCRYIVPMIDARRMEVYTALFSASGQRLSDTRAMIVDGESYRAKREEGTVLFIGDGAAKCAEVLGGPGAAFVQVCPVASAMAALAQEAFDARRFEDPAYFEPFYLKEFVATKGKNLLHSDHERI